MNFYDIIHGALSLHSTMYETGNFRRHDVDFEVRDYYLRVTAQSFTMMRDITDLRPVDVAVQVHKIATDVEAKAAALGEFARKLRVYADSLVSTDSSTQLNGHLQPCPSLTSAP